MKLVRDDNRDWPALGTVMFFRPKKQPPRDPMTYLEGEELIEYLVKEKGWTREEAQTYDDYMSGMIITV